MIKEKYLKEITTRLPDEIIFVDETKFEITDDEFISILCWIKYFNAHYKKHGKDKNPEVLFPVISKRVYLVFDLYMFPSDSGINKGKHVIYLAQNGLLMDGTYKKTNTIKDLINTWQL